jgi:Rha family phage regulatory protein
MTEILNMVINQDNVAKTTSLKVAEVFGKEHKNIIAKIEQITEEMADFSNELKNKPVKNFEKSSYIDSKGEPRTCYEMTRDGFTLLAMGFTGKKALQFKLKYIEAFNKMEEEIVNKKNNNLIIPENFTKLPLEEMLIQTGKWLKVKKEENEQLAQKLLNSSLEAKGKYQRDEISAKINAQIRKVAQETNTPYANVWARLYRMFENNKKRWWWGNAMQAKNHWDFISKNAPIDDL